MLRKIIGVVLLFISIPIGGFIVDKAVRMPLSWFSYSLLMWGLGIWALIFGKGLYMLIQNK